MHQFAQVELQSCRVSEVKLVLSNRSALQVCKKHCETTGQTLSYFVLQQMQYNF